MGSPQWRVGETYRQRSVLYYLFGLRALFICLIAALLFAGEFVGYRTLILCKASAVLERKRSVDLLTGVVGEMRVLLALVEPLRLLLLVGLGV